MYGEREGEPRKRFEKAGVKRVHIGGANMFSRGHVFRREDFFRLLDLEIKRARRYQNLFGVLRFELHGREAAMSRNLGKDVKFVVKLLQEEIRETDVLAQTEKNEIMVILPYCDSSGSEIVHARLNNLIRDFHFGNQNVTVRSGVVCFPMEGTDMEEVLDKLGTQSVRGGSTAQQA
jgi:GGDEF domain-containing protein